VFVLLNCFHNWYDMQFKTQQLEGFDKREERKGYQKNGGSFFDAKKKLEEFYSGKRKQKGAFLISVS